MYIQTYPYFIHYTYVEKERVIVDATDVLRFDTRRTASGIILLVDIFTHYLSYYLNHG